MLAMADLLMRLRRGIVNGRPLLSATAGAKSREEPGQERPRAAWKMEHGSDKPFERTRYDSKSPARLARREAKSELAQIRAHHGLYIATGPASVNSPQVRPAHLGPILRNTASSVNTSFSAVTSRPLQF